MDQGEINSRFGFHRATIEGPEATQPIHVMLRRAFMAFASDLNQVLPYGRETLLSFENLENASMWAHKAIAREAPLEEDDENDAVDVNEIMHQVYGDLLLGGMDGQTASDTIRRMQQNGILFRQIKRKKD